MTARVQRQMTARVQRQMTARMQRHKSAQMEAGVLTAAGTAAQNGAERIRTAQNFKAQTDQGTCMQAAEDPAGLGSPEHMRTGLGCMHVAERVCPAHCERGDQAACN
jgi:hypothetical protein